MSTAMLEEQSMIKLQNPKPSIMSNIHPSLRLDLFCAIKYQIHHERIECSQCTDTLNAANALILRMQPMLSVTTVGWLGLGY